VLKITTTDKESRMAEKGSPYKQVRPEEAITDQQLREDLSKLDEPWQPEKARFRMASVLAIGLLILFGLTVACSGVVITTLVITCAITGISSENPTVVIDKMLQFVTTLIPYIATPLGIALGYFFRESQGGYFFREPQGE
jgi:hypothetical protein